MLKSKIEKEGNRKHIKGTQSQETQILINGCLGDPGLLKGDLFWNIISWTARHLLFILTPRIRDSSYSSYYSVTKNPG